MIQPIEIILTIISGFLNVYVFFRSKNQVVNALNAFGIAGALLFFTWAWRGRNKDFVSALLTAVGGLANG